MTYRIHIIDTQTGEERVAVEDFDWFHADGVGSEFWWTEGNMGCDCNRADVFERAAGREPEPEARCNVGPNRYRVTKAVLPDGREIPLDP